MKDAINLNWKGQLVMSMNAGSGRQWQSSVLHGWTTPALPGFMVLQPQGGASFALTGTTESGRALVDRVEAALLEVMEVHHRRDEMLDHLDFFTYSRPKHVFNASSVKVLELCALIAKIVGDPLAQSGMNTGEGETLESSESELSD